jgi:hypothetical protein
MFRVVIHVEVGSDMIEIRVNGKPVTIREVGSAMSSRWGKYLPDCDCLMVNNVHISEAFVSYLCVNF